MSGCEASDAGGKHILLQWEIYNTAPGITEAVQDFWEFLLFFQAHNLFTVDISGTKDVWINMQSNWNLHTI